ncbi:MAG: sugar phosphate isomerase/epimerase family protein [Pirellulaceae bacterium]
MNHVGRRRFLGSVAAVLAGVTGLSRPRALWAAPAARKFTIDLVCGAIGVQADQREAIRLAHAGGFESVQPSAGELAPLTDAQLQELLQTLRDANLVWGAAGLPVEFRRDDATFQRDLQALPNLAKALERAGASRVGTWLSPGHDELTYLANFRQHAHRLREVAKVLADHGQRFGLEYVGTKTLWSNKRYPFIHTMAETRELLADIGQRNVGLVLDSWHWYTAGETEQDLLSLTNDDVVACDLNDAPAGIPVEQQIDGQRELPAATGVIDVAPFLQALITIGYDGPVRAEPFNRPLNELENEPAVAATAAAMRRALTLVDER